jgi:hypothetical protein
MLNAMFHVLQLINSYEMCNLYVASRNLLYHLENVVLLKVVFSKYDLECQGSNIFSNLPLSAGDNGLPAGGIHFSIANASNKQS